MTRMMFRLALAGVLAGAGWSVGKTQTTVADFELTVDAPGGQTVINCVKGCDFTHDVGRIETRPNTKFVFSCSAERCRATINGSGNVLR
jgi:hypothetical protein